MLAWLFLGDILDPRTPFLWTGSRLGWGAKIFLVPHPKLAEVQMRRVVSIDQNN